MSKIIDGLAVKDDEADFDLNNALILLILAFETPHILTIQKLLKSNTAGNLWKRCRAQLSPFIHKDLFEVFCEIDLPWNQRAFKYALILSNISSEKSERDKLKDYFKSIICSDEFSDFSIVARYWNQL